MDNFNWRSAAFATHTNKMKKVQLEHGFDHPDARAYGDAYVQALERPKHGKAITLPPHLHY